MATDKPIVVKGVKVNVTADDFDDVEILEMVENGAIPSIMRKVFGAEKYEEVKKALYDEEAGKTRTSALGEWLDEVMGKVGAKN